ncbi:MAG: ABC transporter substrate-binding protein [Candidatus Binatia bacterium]
MSIASRTIVLVLSVLLTVSAVRADNPNAPNVVNSVQETLLAVMKDADALGVSGRYEELLPPLREAFDFERMIQFASGSSWRNATNEQREKLVDAFTHMSVSTYAAQFNGYSGEVFETLGQRDGPRGSVLVDTQIVRSADSPVAITYVLTETDGRWRIVDLVLDKKVSEMAIRRSEYNPILREGGPTELAAALNEKADRLLTE